MQILLIIILFLEVSVVVPKSKRSVGGTITEASHFPFLVSIRYYSDHVCGGTIISDEWVLTAAHCLKNRTADKITVVLGESVLTNDSYGLKGKVENVYPHPESKITLYLLKNDIGLIQVKFPQKSIHKIDFGKIKSDGARVISAGWGRHRSDKRVSFGDKLRFLHLTTINAKRCQTMYQASAVLIEGDQQICAVSTNGTALCVGDSGGPLVDLKSGKLIGVFTGVKTCTGKYPHIFTRIEFYLPWINEVTDRSFGIN